MINKALGKPRLIRNLEVLSYPYLTVVYARPGDGKLLYMTGYSNFCEKETTGFICTESVVAPKGFNNSIIASEFNHTRNDLIYTINKVYKAGATSTIFIEQYIEETTSDTIQVLRELQDLARMLNIHLCIGVYKPFKEVIC